MLYNVKHNPSRTILLQKYLSPFLTLKPCEWISKMYQYLMSGAQLTRNYWLEEKAEMGQSLVKGILLNIIMRCFQL